MGNLVSAGLPLPRLDDVAVQVGRPARSEIITAIAGTTRFLSEYVTGVQPAGNQHCAPFTPLGGGVGHDHSGGVMGMPLNYPFAWWQWGYPANQANVVGAFGPRNQVDATSTSRPVAKLLLRTPFIPAGVAYQTAKVVIVVRADAACSVTASMTRAGAAVTITQALTINTTTVLEPTNRLPLYPGKINMILLEVTATYTSATANLYLLSASLNQFQTEP